MSNAKRNMLGTATHALDYVGKGGTAFGMCGADARHAAERPDRVTCRRCLASLAKRDREFQRKARGWFRRFDEPRMRCVRDGLPPVKRPSEASLAVQRERTLGGTPLGYRQVWDAMAAMAARAIAREEGRAL